MFLRLLDFPLNNISEFKEKKEFSSAIPKLNRLGILKASDLLLHYPRGWEDRSRINPLNGYNKEKVCAIVTVFAHEWMFFGKKKTLKIYIEDETAQAVLLCFNRPWMGKLLVKGNQYYIFGSFKYEYGEIRTSSFEFESVNSKDKFIRILPVYPLTQGLFQTTLRSMTEIALKKYAEKIENELPISIIERDNLLSKSAAIKEIHFPSSMETLALAKKSLIYEELFYLEVIIGMRSIERKRSLERKKHQISTTEFHGDDNKSSFNSVSSVTSVVKNYHQASLGKIRDDSNCILWTPQQKRLLDRLPFSLTSGQAEAALEINADITSPIPMARLLQGDVGCGKTLVSFLAALKAADGGGQSAIMAPTELLARQLAENAARLLEPLGVNVAFLTGNIKTAGRKELVKNLSAGEIDIVVGTHALFSKDIKYKNLKLVVIDEQHRFGVTQRSLIMSKGNFPDLLMMSATPIPRTLALTVFGDMDVSSIKDLPPGRKPVKTHLSKESNAKKVYDFVRNELEKGHQAYFVYPLIEEGVISDLKDAVSMAEKLSKQVFPKHKTALIHSKLTEDEKRQTMEDFRKGEIHILAATSVVEVGVDVPNATCMVIEHAERFGLSALHQLRGRVGRGVEQSYCFLVYSDELTEDGKIRLKVMLENSDGFVIAEEDLKLRGPGLIAGTQQSGFLELGIANPIRDFEELERARKDAFSILENDPNFLLTDHRIIARVLEEAPPFAQVAL
ncbi:MAG: ATP-dependent DNA helicase RecG [Treponema sp.]|jgi:ATP-dependent DNA helicase RecG|nr:ATP-dependent DNA helicase RecG [Treponema sp.]